MSPRNGPAIDAGSDFVGSSLVLRESQSASKHPRRITTTVCPSNLNVGRRFYDRWMTWNRKVSHLILRSREAASRRMSGTGWATWFETALSRLLTTRFESELILPAADTAGRARPFLD